MYLYSVYGLKISSEIELPELYSLEFHSADVQIRVGAVPRRLRSPDVRTDWAELTENACLLRVPQVGRFLIEDGETITIEADHFGVRPELTSDIRVFILGSSLGTLLHQRKSLPLHVAAVMTAHGLVGFTGPSGAGKSTLGGWFMKHSRRPLFSDDMAALHLADDSLQLFAGPRRLKLCQDAMEHLEFDPDYAAKVMSNKPKYQIIANQAVVPASRPMIAMIELARHTVPTHPVLERLRGKEAFDVMMGAVYRPVIGDWFHKHERLIGLIANLCSRIKVYRFTRSWSLDHLSVDLKFLAERIETIRPDSELPNDNAVPSDG